MRNLPSSRLWLFRLVAMVGIPLVSFGLLELALWVGGYGTPTTFFVRREIDGKPCLVENSWFGLRFFPPGLARSPAPLVMAPVKPPGTLRIFLFGESAALGDPRPAYGMGRYLELLLAHRYPELRFEVVCVAMTAINSHAILPIARECARHDGDLWVIYMGNNEMSGPFGANTVFGVRAPPKWSVRAYLALQQTRTGQLLVALARRLARGSGEPGNWGGMKMFLASQLAPDDPRKETVYANFESNLQDILNVGKQHGVPVLLCSVASNLKDCAPFASLHSPAPALATLSQWQGHMRSGETNETKHQYEAAVADYIRAAELSPKYAETHFRLGQAMLQVTNRPVHKTHLELARDYDALPFRADARINRILRNAAKRHAGAGERVGWLDSEALLAPPGETNVPGEASFLEHVHFNPEGNYRLGKGLAQQAETLLRLPEKTRISRATDWADEAQCARDLGLTDWNSYSTLEEVQKRLSEPPFTNQYDHEQRMRRLQVAKAALAGNLQARAVPEARSLYEESVRKNPQDFWLRQNYADFLTSVGDMPGAAEQLRAVTKIIPHHHAAYFHLGRLLGRLKRYDEAKIALDTAWRLRPDFVDARLELGGLLRAQGRSEDALREYRTVEMAQPRNARVRLLKAEIYQELKRRDEAIGSLREAIQIQPDYWEARELLGMLLGIDRRYSEAQIEFEELVRLRPDYADGHFNLAIALAQQGRYQAAAKHLRSVRELDPDNRRAQEMLETFEEMSTASPDQK